MVAPMGRSRVRLCNRNDGRTGRVYSIYRCAGGGVKLYPCTRYLSASPSHS